MASVLYKSTDVVITSAVRTPVGNICGSLSSLKAHELGAVVIKEALERSKSSPADVSEVILGQVLTAGSFRLCYISTVVATKETSLHKE